LALKFQLELDFDGENWIIHLDDRVLKADNIEKLGILFKEYLKTKGIKGEVEVSVRYDWKKLPQWLWQYQSYYFERTWHFHI